MAVIKITELPSATLPLSYAEHAPIVQNSVTKKVTLSGMMSAKIDNFTGTGSQLIFTLTDSTNENATNVFINGVYQQKNTYTVSGATLTFSEAPPVTSSIEVAYF